MLKRDKRFVVPTTATICNFKSVFIVDFDLVTFTFDRLTSEAYHSVTLCEINIFTTR